MTPPSGERVCAGCGDRRNVSDLLVVRDTENGALRFVCRPSIKPHCFMHNVRIATRDEIALAHDPRTAAA